ncbi:MAG: succinate dehydrogenase, hydrophobic membrane anchor protein [Pseudomonadota bacterium]
MSYRTPRARAAFLGSAHDGVHHWWSIKLTSYALVPLTILFVIPFAGVLGEGRAAMLELYGDPFHAIIAALFIGVTFYHLYLGLQVVVQDYIHDKGQLMAAHIAVMAVCGLGGVAGVFSVLKIAFMG